MFGAAVILVISGACDDAVCRTATVFCLLVILLSFYVFVHYYVDYVGARFANLWQWLELSGPWQFGGIGMLLTLGGYGVAALVLLLTGHRDVHWYIGVVVNQVMEHG